MGACLTQSLWLPPPQVFSDTWPFPSAQTTEIPYNHPLTSHLSSCNFPGTALQRCPLPTEVPSSNTQQRSFLPTPPGAWLFQSARQHCHPLPRLPFLSCLDSRETLMSPICELMRSPHPHQPEFSIIHQPKDPACFPPAPFLLSSAAFRVTSCFHGLTYNNNPSSGTS